MQPSLKNCNHSTIKKPVANGDTNLKPTENKSGLGWTRIRGPIRNLQACEAFGPFHYGPKLTDCPPLGWGTLPIIYLSHLQVLETTCSTS